MKPSLRQIATDKKPMSVYTDESDRDETWYYSPFLFFLHGFSF